MKYRNIGLLSISIFLLLFSACGTSVSTSKDESKNSNSIQQMPKDSTTLVREKLNDIAKFISGIPLDKNSELYDLTQTPEWVDYSAESQTAWNRFDSVAAKYRAFSKSEIPAPYDTLKTVFYPFSGPDFLFANILFPDVEKMILIGLESPGSVPKIDSTVQDSLKNILELFKVSIEDVIQLSFFRTIDMKNELGNKIIDGTTPIILLFLARSGKEVVEVNPMYLNHDGILTKIEKTRPSMTASAVEILYHDKNDNKIKSIYYLSTNLADPSLSQNKPFVKFLENIDNNVITFVKSATYLMHKSYFSIIRNTCLNKSLLILQDDSGIGFKYFNKDKWEIRLYGTYIKPIKLFEDFFEPDYFEAFKSDNPKPLHFRIGYSPKSNLLMAIKK